MRPPLLALLRHLSWPELRLHPWRHIAALVAVALGVALALAVHLINESALSEFSQAVRQINGQPDLELRGTDGKGFEEALYRQLGMQPGVQLASPVIERATYALDAGERRVPVRVLGLDALSAGPLSPALIPRSFEAAQAPPTEGAQVSAERFAFLARDTVFLNSEARQALGLPALGQGDEWIQLQVGLKLQRFRVAGRIAAGGGPLAVMDIATAQVAFGMVGRLSRIDLQFQPGADEAQVMKALALPPDVVVQRPADQTQRVSTLSRAYRVNLTVLALVALFTGAFLVFAVLSLGVAKRSPQLALLGVLGLPQRERLQLVLAEAALLGTAGALLGVALGTGLAWTALRLLAGDLGGGYFPGVTPALRFTPWAALLFAGLGLVAALLGAWGPARTAQRLAPAQTLKGMGADVTALRRWPGPVLLVLGTALAFAPPVARLPLFAYVSVALLLMGGIACVPMVVSAALRLIHPLTQWRAETLLGVARVQHDRQSATAAIAGVVASVSLAVALTVMVASFRDAVTQWLERVLPADLYVRTASTAAASDAAFFDASVVAQIRALDGVAGVDAIRLVSLTLDPARPSVAVVGRPLADAAKELPLVGDTTQLQTVAPPGAIDGYASEALVQLYGARPGSLLTVPLGGREQPVFIRAVWRDYARQHGSLVIPLASYQQASGDLRLNDLAISLTAGARLSQVQQSVRGVLAQPALVEFATSSDIRQVSLRIFDRSFAVTYWLQAVAIAIGLFGIAASFSAQVLARSREFGALAHLGLTRRQVLAVVTTEGAALSFVGAALGVGLGIAVSVVLVKVVNPQSFNWTMDLLLPWGRLLLLGAAVVAAGTVTAWLAGRAAASRQAVLAVREDW
jgi:putative ABC transport system permease protein